MTSGGLTIKEVNDALDRLSASDNRYLIHPFCLHLCMTAKSELRNSSLFLVGLRRL
jgi:hypothetical protein